MEKSCGLVVFNSNKILLLKYSANNTQGEGGHWDFPKGHVEQNETELETALRELEEETGISKVEIIADFRHSISYTFSRRSESISKEVIFFLASTVEKRVTLSHEHIDYAWLDFNNALEKLTYENARQILKKALPYTKK
ncbi:MAG: NUDIX domain-containing protein [Candidatus Poseidoniia archaeon]|jgi:bis(5'-nucleosidyl)-tetraphosphatase|nr:NUDIX domain-containing protein [Candidatus Poseidoniia archaeon]|tara:strand:+ start:1245 stop:1661 length:417 start_codon:yes stop_codon:yes gene_type:complete